MMVAALQKMAAVETSSAEERERLRATYKQRMQDMDARLKVRLFDADEYGMTACRPQVQGFCASTVHTMTAVLSLVT
jgi:hypothetical protein